MPEELVFQIIPAAMSVAEEEAAALEGLALHIAAATAVMVVSVFSHRLPEQQYIMPAAEAGHLTAARRVLAALA